MNKLIELTEQRALLNHAHLRHLEEAMNRSTPNPLASTPADRGKQPGTSAPARDPARTHAVLQELWQRRDKGHPAHPSGTLEVVGAELEKALLAIVVTPTPGPAGKP